ncbi:MAG: helix-turn-helix transcriptional regulator [Flavobacteriales bacterium]
MPVVKNVQLRFRIIDSVLRNKYKPFPTLEDLRQLCEEKLYGTSHGQHISASTIEKDLRELRNEFDAPIAFSKRELGYYYTDETYSLDLPVSEDEVESIKLATQALLQFSNIPLFDDFRHAVNKILERVDIQSTNTEANAFIQFETPSETKGRELLQPILQCIKDSKKINITYKRFDTETNKEYLVHPYILKEYRNRWYLIGKNEEKSKIATFGLDRIESITATENHFIQDDSFNAAAYFKNSVGITVFDEKVRQIKVHVDELVAKYLITQPLHASQQHKHIENGKVEFTWKVLLTYELKNHLLSLGSACTVIEPKELREEITKEIIAAHKNYL